MSFCRCSFQSCKLIIETVWRDHLSLQFEIFHLFNDNYPQSTAVDPLKYRYKWTRIQYLYSLMTIHIKWLYTFLPVPKRVLSHTVWILHGTGKTLSYKHTQNFSNQKNWGETYFIHSINTSLRCLKNKSRCSYLCVNCIYKPSEPPV